MCAPRFSALAVVRTNLKSSEEQRKRQRNKKNEQDFRMQPQEYGREPHIHLTPPASHWAATLKRMFSLLKILMSAIK